MTLDAVNLPTVFLAAPGLPVGYPYELCHTFYGNAIGLPAEDIFGVHGSLVLLSAVVPNIPPSPIVSTAEEGTITIEPRSLIAS